MVLFAVPFENTVNFLQWNPDITMYQGTGKITSFYWGIVLNELIPNTTILEKNNQNYRYIGVYFICS